MTHARRGSQLNGIGKDGKVAGLHNSLSKRGDQLCHQSTCFNQGATRVQLSTRLTSVIPLVSNFLHPPCISGFFSHLESIISVNAIW